MIFKYKEKSGNIVITGIEDIKARRIEIPKEIDGKTVTKIGDSSFQFCEEITDIIIPDSVTEIGKWAFSSCSNLINISIPNSVVEIGRNAFSYCINLTTIHIPDNVTEIGNSVFSGCHSLTSINIPNSVTKIGWYAFVDCSSLTRIHFPDSILSIGGAALKGCSCLSHINIPNDVEEIGWHVFEGCIKLEAINISSENKHYSTLEGVLYDKLQTTLICFPINKDEFFMIPKSVTKIREDAFWGCKNLTSITISDRVTEIGDHAFSGCRLKSIVIPESVMAIGPWAFGDCSNLSRITVTGEGKGDLKTLQELKKGILNNHIKYFSGSKKAFDVLLTSEQKMKLAISYCKGEIEYNQCDKELYNAYVALNSEIITCELVHNDSVKGLTHMVKIKKLTSKNIDKFIELANKEKAIDALVFLMEYKNNNIALQDNDKFLL